MRGHIFEESLTLLEVIDLAGSFLQELELTNQLIDQQFSLRRQEIQTRLDDLNLQADIGLQLLSNSQSQLGANARLAAELAAEESAARGRFFGQAFESFTSALGQGVRGLFGSGGGVSLDAAGRILGGI